MAFARPIAQALRASVARDASRDDWTAAFAALPGAAGRELAAAATYHGIAGYVWRAATRADAPAALTDPLSDVVQRSTGAHLRTLADLDTVAGAFERAGVPWLVVKGPVLSATVHERPELRSYSDLDLVVPPAALGDAMAALEAAGGTALDRNWDLFGRELKGEVHVRLPWGTIADLHWTLLNERHLRDQHRVWTDDLFPRARVVEVGRTSVPTLDEVDTLLHVALHTMMSGGHRLIWLKDVERTLHHVTADADVVRRRARQWGVELTLAAALSRARAATGLPATAAALGPRGVLDRGWLALCAAAWRVRPAEAEDGGGSIARIVARSGRADARGSARALVAKSRGHLYERRVSGAPADRKPAPTSPLSDRYDAGGEEGRQAYLHAVARYGR